MRVFRIIILMCVLSGASGQAEMRMWTLSDGTRLEAKFVRELFGNIQVRDPDGETRMIELKDLSKKDVRYVSYEAPPEIEIGFKKKCRVRPPLEWTLDKDQTLLHTCTVRLDKKNRLPSKGKLTAELFILAEEVDGDNYILLHREVNSFVFPKGRKSFYEFSTGEIPARTYTAWWMDTTPLKRGATYLGYLVVVHNSKGLLVASDTDLKSEHWLSDDILSSVQGLREIAINGRASVFSRHFNTRFKKVMVPRVPWHRRSKTPGGA